MMKSLVSFVFVLALLLISSVYAQQRQLGVEDSRAERRVALVIGNSAYLTLPLKNPVNDAQDMAQALRGLGFTVIYRENLNQNDMKRAIREFGAKIRGGGIGLFYYAGHGVQVKGINYLVPVDATVESEEEVEYEGVDAGFVLAQMESAGNGMNIMILDACRNNPFARSFRSSSRGLAQMDAPGGTLIAYATAPGSVASDGNARNGLYTQELLKFVRTPNLSIEEVFKRVRISVRNLTQGKQTPWEASSLIGEFYFISEENSTDVKPPKPSVDPVAIELVYWETIKNSTDPEDFKEYLSKYPNGQFAGLAKRRATALTKPSAASQPTNVVPSLQGTLWAGTDSKGDYYEFEFLQAGRLRYKVTRKSGGTNVYNDNTDSWRQTGDIIVIEMSNGYARYEGNLTGGSLEFKAHNEVGLRWSISMTRIR
jgi:hypothetical protein